MSAPSTLLPPPKPLDPSADAWLGWKTWKCEFTLFATATQLCKQPKEVQAATLLVTVGEEGRKAYSAFKFENEADRNNVDILLQKFEEFYKPVTNLTFNEFRFGSRDQKQGECFNDWLTDLRLLAKNCEFGDLEDRLLRSRIILGLRNKSLQERLISENPSYSKTIEICRAQELGKEQFKEISEGTEAARAAVFEAIATERKRCSHCGYTTHRGETCPAEGKTCKKCGGRNHFAQACRSSVRRQSRGVKNVLREVQAEDDFFLQALTVSAVDAADHWSATVDIEGRKFTCKLDTGANCCVISSKDVKQLPNKLQQPCQATLTAFFGHKTTARAKIRLRLLANRREHEESFFVVEQNVPVTLSGSVAERLGFLCRVQNVHVEELFPAAQPFAEVFSGLGQLKGVEYTMKLKPGAVGVVVPARRVPVALQDKVKEELQRMEEQGVIAKVKGPTEWSSYMVTVVKKDKVRICLDPIALNKALLREHYPMPTLEDVPKLAGANVFSTLDAASGFWQIKLDDSSSKLCTMSTPYGRYRFLLMPFGIASAPEIFQAAMHHVLEGLPNVAVVMDDILLWGKTKQEHDHSLQLLLTPCREQNLRLNLKKCFFLQREVRYLGHVLSAEGLRVDAQRIQDILKMPTPKNCKELQVFLGTMNFVQRFIPNMSVVTAPLRTLLRKDIAWVWTEKQQESFLRLREALIQAPVLRYFDPSKPVTLSVDASQLGVGAVLIQNAQPIAFSSRTLTEAQTRYAQIEKETLAIVHGCTKFHDYIFGQHAVTVETDHRPLVAIFSKPLYQCPLRLQRMRLTLQRYPINVTYKPGKELFLADALSRFPSKRFMEENEQFQVNVLECVSASQRSLQDLLAATNDDDTLVKLREYANTTWPLHKQEVPEPLRTYWAYWDEIHAQDGLVFRSNKVIVPQSKISEMMSLLHAAHVGADKMKARARNVMFWPNISSNIEQFCRACKVCQAHQPRNPKMPLLSHDVPSLPWEVVGMDLFFFEGHEFALVVDFYSFFFEIREFRTTTAGSLNTWCSQIFSVHGLPRKLCTDNGLPFNSREFKDFLNTLGVDHITSSPYHPRSNGMTERAVQEAKKLLKKCSFKMPVFQMALLEWRNTPRDDVLQSPVQRLMGRQTRTRLPVPTSHLEPRTIPSDVVQGRLQDIRQRQRTYYNRGSRNLSPVMPGQPVTVYDTNQRTWSPAVVLRPADEHRSTIVQTEDGRELRRTREHLRLVDPQPEVSHVPEDGSSTEPPQELRRSTRQRREPCRYPQQEIR